MLSKIQQKGYIVFFAIWVQKKRGNQWFFNISRNILQKHVFYKCFFQSELKQPYKTYKVKKLQIALQRLHCNDCKTMTACLHCLGSTRWDHIYIYNNRISYIWYVLISIVYHLYGMFIYHVHIHITSLFLREVVKLQNDNTPAQELTRRWPRGVRRLVANECGEALPLPSLPWQGREGCTCTVGGLPSGNTKTTYFSWGIHICMCMI